MNTIKAKEFKARLSDIIKQARAGEEFEITDENGEVIGYFVGEKAEKLKRKLGILEGKATCTFAPDFKMTEDEFLGL